MRICFSIKNDVSEDMKLTDRFGESDRFIVFDTQIETFTAHKSSPAQCQGSCCCHLPSMPKRVFDAVICRSIGAGAFTIFRRNRIDVFLTEERNVENALNGWKKKVLPQAKRGYCSPEVTVRRRE